MRRYDIVSGILLILPIIDFALAAPVLVQEKRQACVDVVHIPRDMITVLWKRGPGGEEVEKLAEEFSKTLNKPVDSSESSGAHASPSSAPLGPDHDSELGNVVQAPARDPASSTANPSLLVEPSSPSSTAYFGDKSSESSDSESWSDANDWWGVPNGPYDKLTGAQAPDPRPLKAPDLDWNKINLGEPPPRKRPKLASSKEFGQTDEEQLQLPNPPSNPGLSNARPLNPGLSDLRPLNPGLSSPRPLNPGLSNPRPLNPGLSALRPLNPGFLNPRSLNPRLSNSRPSKAPDFDWNQINLGEPPPQKWPKLASSKGFGQTDED
jgi:hypothetical protein